jgi:hypothetical protein
MGSAMSAAGILFPRLIQAVGTTRVRGRNSSRITSEGAEAIPSPRNTVSYVVQPTSS